MDPSIAVETLGLVALVALMLWDTTALDRRARTRRTRAREAGAARRCPFCRAGLQEGEERGRCRACGTAHHAECWEEHGQCTVFGCPSEHLEQVEADPELPRLVTEPASRG